MFLFNSSRYARAYFDWSDSVGIGVDSWACARHRRWSNTTVMLFGSQPMSFMNISNADVRLDEGRPHVMIVEKGYIYCALRGPMPSPPDAASPDEDRSLPGGVPQRSGGGGGLASGPVAGIAVGAALAGVAAAAAVAFGYRRWVATRNRGGDLSGGGGGGGGGGGSGGGDTTAAAVTRQRRRRGKAWRGRGTRQPSNHRILFTSVLDAAVSVQPSNARVGWAACAQGAPLCAVTCRGSVEHVAASPLFPSTGNNRLTATHEHAPHRTVTAVFF